MRSCYLIFLMLISTILYAGVCNTGDHRAKLAHPPPDWTSGTETYLRQSVANCFNVTTGAPKGCDPKDLKKLDELMDTTSPSKRGDGVPIGVKPDRDLSAMDPVQAAAIRSERRAAQKLARNGFEVRYASDENIFDPDTRKLILEARQKHGLRENANFDLLVEGKPFDVYSPHGNSTMDTIKTTLAQKSEKQTGRVVIYAESNGQMSRSEFRSQLQNELRKSPSDRLREVLVVKDDGKIERIFP